MSFQENILSIGPYSLPPRLRPPQNFSHIYAYRCILGCMQLKTESIKNAPAVT